MATKFGACWQVLPGKMPKYEMPETGWLEDKRDWKEETVERRIKCQYKALRMNLSAACLYPIVYVGFEFSKLWNTTYKFYYTYILDTF